MERMRKGQDMERPERTRRSLVGDTADKLRNLVFAAEPNSFIGSLQTLARALEVGIVTVQQAARVLEHEGLLEVRRGPGGGYYGVRPDAAAVERSMTAFMRSYPTSFEEALDITSLLFNELVPAAATCDDAALKAELGRLLPRLDGCGTDADCGAFENAFQDLLFRMVDRPLFKLLTLVTLQVGLTQSQRLLDGRGDAVVKWKEGRRRIIHAIFAGDPDLARFEADRSNRRPLMERLISGSGSQ